MTSEGTTELVDVKLDITPKGTPYGILKLKGLGDPDTGEPGELFIFSDILELNRNSLIEGNSLILTLSKNISDNENRFKRINVKK